MSAKSIEAFGSSEPKQVSSDSTASAPTSFANRTYSASSEYEVQFWNLIKSFDSILSDVSENDDKLQDSTLRDSLKEIKIITEEMERLNSSISVLLSKVSKENESSIVILSGLDDLQRQMKESCSILNTKMDPKDNEHDMTGIGILDEQSELTRRKLLGKSCMVQKSVGRLSEQLQFLESFIKKEQISHPFPYANQARFKRRTFKDSRICILDSLAKGYSRLKVLDQNVSKLTTEMESRNQVHFVGKKPNAITPAGKRGRRNRLSITPLPFSSPLSQSKPTRILSENNVSILKAMQNVKKSHGQPLKLLSRREIQFLPPCDTSSTTSSWRKGHSSKLMSSLNTFGATSSSTSLKLSSPDIPKKIDLFPSSNITMRTDWNVSKAETNGSSSLSIPTSLKQIDVKRAEKEALVSFGVTPEKMNKVFEAKLRAESLKFSTDKPKTSQQQNVLDSKTMSSFGKIPLDSSNMSVSSSSATISAPKSSVTPSSVPSKVKDPKSTPKDLNGAYPPVSIKAPTPFGTSSTEKEVKVDPKLEPQKLDEGKSMNEGGLFGSVAKSLTSTKQVSFATKTNESLSLPFGSSATPAFASSALNVASTTVKSSTTQPKYEELLTAFYQKHNPSKLSEVKSNLQKYAGKEKEMFSKLSQKYGVPNPLDQSSTSLESSTTQPNYEELLTAFYQKHNPNKLSEVKSNLQKYAGKEKEMFSKLSQKYGVPNPLNTSDTGAVPIGQSISSSAPAASPFNQPNSTVPFGNSALTPMTTSPFASSKAQQATPFGSSTAAPNPFGTNSVFGPSATPFGASNNPTSKSPFSQNQNTSQSPFSANITASTTPFGQGSSPTPFSTSASSGGSTFGGKSAKEILTSFYHRHNPSKVDEVDKLLQKYSGNEEQLFRNLAKKYNIDPSMFGVTNNTPAASFGSSSTFGQPSAPATSSGLGSSAFGQSSALGSSGGFAQSFGQTSGFGAMSSGQSSGFASFSQSAQGTGFGGLSGSTPSFGGGGFGTTSSPFGSARR
jgi:formiminotetrahydrofolate cyclodeaminase